MLNKILSAGFLLFIILQGCINLEDKISINKDGSGSMVIHYWALNKDIILGKIGDFAFTQSRVSANFNSLTTEAEDIRVEKKDTDSVTHVYLNFKFRDFNRISEAKSFARVKPYWNADKDSIIFRFSILPDSSTASQPNMTFYKLDFDFEFPSRILAANVPFNGNSIKWSKTVADLSRDNELTAIIDKKGSCGIFGFEFPVFILIGMAVIYGKLRNFSNF